MPAEARYVLVKGDSGLGNRILCLLSALLLARITGRRVLVDWCDSLYAPTGQNAFPHLFTSDLVAPLAELPDTGSVAPPPWRGRLAESALSVRDPFVHRRHEDPLAWERFTVDLSRIDRPERVLVFTSFFEQIEPLRRHLHGAHAALRPLATDVLLARLWDEHLALAPALRERVAEIRSSFTRPVLGLHVRASDLRTRHAAIEAAATRMVAHRPELAIFLATDNHDVVRHYRQRFANVVTTDKWYPPPGTAMHLHPDRPDTLRGAADALVDLHLLASCDHLVVDSRSSFGRLAALRCRAPADRVIDVHPGRLIPLGIRRRVLRLRSIAIRLADASRRGTA